MEHLLGQCRAAGKLTQKAHENHHYCKRLRYDIHEQMRPRAGLLALQAVENTVVCWDRTPWPGALDGGDQRLIIGADADGQFRWS